MSFQFKIRLKKKLIYREFCVILRTLYSLVPLQYQNEQRKLLLKTEKIIVKQDSSKENGSLATNLEANIRNIIYSGPNIRKIFTGEY